MFSLARKLQIKSLSAFEHITVGREHVGRKALKEGTKKERYELKEKSKVRLKSFVEAVQKKWKERRAS